MAGTKEAVVKAGRRPPGGLGLDDGAESVAPADHGVGAPPGGSWLPFQVPTDESAAVEVIEANCQSTGLLWDRSDRAFKGRVANDARQRRVPFNGTFELPTAHSMRRVLGTYDESTVFKTMERMKARPERPPIVHLERVGRDGFHLAPGR